MSDQDDAGVEQVDGNELDREAEKITSIFNKRTSVIGDTNE